MSHVIWLLQALQNDGAFSSRFNTIFEKKKWIIWYRVKTTKDSLVLTSMKYCHNDFNFLRTHTSVSLKTLFCQVVVHLLVLGATLPLQLAWLTPSQRWIHFRPLLLLLLWLLSKHINTRRFRLERRRVHPSEARLHQLHRSGFCCLPLCPCHSAHILQVLTSLCTLVHVPGLK